MAEQRGIIGILEGNERERYRKTFVELMTKVLPDFMNKFRDQRISTNFKLNKQKHIKTHHNTLLKEKILNTAREKRRYYVQRNKDNNINRFLIRNYKARSQE